MITTRLLFNAFAIALFAAVTAQDSQAVMIDLSSPRTQLNGNRIATSDGLHVGQSGLGEIDFIAEYLNDQPIVLDIEVVSGDSVAKLAMSAALLNMTTDHWSTLEVRLSDGMRFANLHRLGLAADLTLLNERQIAILELHESIPPDETYVIGVPNDRADELDWMITLDGFAIGDRFTISLQTRGTAVVQSAAVPVPEPNTVALILLAFALIAARQKPDFRLCFAPVGLRK